jgi:hypothetical protein
MRVVVNPYMGTSLTRLSGFMLSFRRPISFADQFGQLDKSDRREGQPRNGEDAFSKTLMRSTRNPATSPSSVPARCAAGSVVLRCTVLPRWISPTAKAAATVVLPTPRQSQGHRS